MVFFWFSLILISFSLISIEFADISFIHSAAPRSSQRRGFAAIVGAPDNIGLCIVYVCINNPLAKLPFLSLYSMGKAYLTQPLRSVGHVTSVVPQGLIDSLCYNSMKPDPKKFHVPKHVFVGDLADWTPLLVLSRIPASTSSHDQAIACSQRHMRCS